MRHLKCPWVYDITQQSLKKIRKAAKKKKLRLHATCFYLKHLGPEALKTADSLAKKQRTITIVEKTDKKRQKQTVSIKQIKKRIKNL